MAASMFWSTNKREDKEKPHSDGNLSPSNTVDIIKGLWTLSWHIIMARFQILVKIMPQKARFASLLVMNNKEKVSESIMSRFSFRFCILFPRI